MELSSESEYISDRLSNLNDISSNRVFSISNVSAVDNYKSRDSKLNQFKLENIYYNIIKKINRHNYKCYEEDINIYFGKIEKCKNCYLIDIHKSGGDRGEYKVDWDERKNIEEILHNHKISPFKYTGRKQGRCVTVLYK